MSTTDTTRSGDAATPVLDAEKLDVYHLALELQRLVSRVLSRAPGSLRDQLDRASVSIVLNVAEGAGRRSRADKARLFAIAHGSATECAALFDLLRARGAMSETDGVNARALVVRIVQMLTRLMSGRPQESSS